MTDVRWKQRFANFRRALNQLGQAVELQNLRPLTELESQGLIQAFEFTHELAWNVLKDYLEYEGISGLTGSRSTVREAFKRGLIADGEVWLDMIDKRNLSSYTYNVQVAQSVVQAVRSLYYPAFRALENRLLGEI
ncbi:MAG: nucleotidyltransferase substrate binding protein [Bdellovibrionaceae bacterium]|nr:nucleotidyltransferase substrate binding protein [Pseudobdellovibrionaceae bacterium]